MKTLTIKHLMLMTAVLLGTVSLLFISTVQYMFGSINTSSNKQQHSMRAVMDLKDARFHVIQIQQFLTDVGATGDSGGFVEAQINLDRAKASLNKVTAGFPQMEAEVTEAQHMVDSVYDIGVRMARAYIDAGRAAGNRLMKAPEAGFDVLSEDLATHLDQMTTHLDNEFQHANSKMLATQNSVHNTIIGFSVGFMIIGGLALIMIYRKVLPPINHLCASLRNMNTGNGDLTRRIASENDDEVGEIISEFNNFIALLHELMQDVASATTQLGGAAQEMSSLTEKTRQGVLKQQLETDQVATAMNEMSATVQEVARNAVHAADETRKADEESSAGRRVVSTTISTIEQLASEVGNAAGVIHQLEEDSESIGTVLDVIGSIAEQTNLLALNAAIEAARAGEHGRGFAVVADEVRTLAGRTQQSTQEIQAMIQRLQEGAKNAVDVMKRSQEQAVVSVEQAASADAALDSITGIVSTIADMSTQIAAASEQQRAVAEEINNNILAITQVAGETEQGAGETANSSKVLSSMADQLQSIVAQFKVS